MKKSVCFYFQIHNPFQLQQYRFFDIGHSHQYYDEFATRTYLQKLATSCYLPMNKVLLDTINEFGNKFKVAFSITGETLNQFEKYAPNVLDSFKELAATGCVEFLCETYCHSLAFLKDEDELDRLLLKQCEVIERHFEQVPSVVRLTGLIYSDQIGNRVAKLGFDGMLTEGAKHILGWKTPNFVYTNAINNDLKVLLRNYNLSDDIAYRFSDKSSAKWTVTTEKFVGWLDELDKEDEVINLFMDYLTFGYRHPRSSGIFDFMRFLPREILKHKEYEFLTPTEVINKHQPKADIHVPYPISWSEEERDLSVWLGNDLQNDAFTSLCDLGTKVRFINDEHITRDWERMQDSNHFYDMGTKWMIDGSTRRFDSLYSSPYDAYINYMNILSDLILRVNEKVNEKVSELKKNKLYADKIENITAIPSRYLEYSLSQIRQIIEITDKNPRTESPKIRI